MIKEGETVERVEGGRRRERRELIWREKERAEMIHIREGVESEEDVDGGTGRSEG